MRFQNYIEEYEYEHAFEKLINEGVYDPSIFKAIFLAGGPGSGKSFVAGKTTGGLGFRIANSDTVFEKLGKQKGLDLQTMPKSEKEARDKVRERAKDLTNKQLLRYIRSRLGVVIDGTGRGYEKISRQKEALEKRGYDTFMIFVDTTLDVAMERNRERAKFPPYRSVPENIVKKGWEGVQKNKTTFRKLFRKNYQIVDNNKYSSDKEVFADVWKVVMKFAQKKPKNPIAKAWIDEQLKAKSAITGNFGKQTIRKKEHFEDLLGSKPIE